MLAAPANARILGADASPGMLTRARARARPGGVLVAQECSVVDHRVSRLVRDLVCWGSSMPLGLVIDRPVPEARQQGCDRAHLESELLMDASSGRVLDVLTRAGMAAAGVVRNPYPSSRGASRATGSKCRTLTLAWSRGRRRRQDVE